jgi:choline dehydrogenase-like flavoprotein
MIDTSNKEIQSHYDFIVVGAGAAGSVLAAELSASGSRVLVIESGGPDDAATIANPSIWFLFGTDFPYLRRDLAVNAKQRILESSELNDLEKHAILGTNAARLMPRLGSVAREM